MNPEGSKTAWLLRRQGNMFESSVNPEGSKTISYGIMMHSWFESSVNPEGSKTGLLLDLPTTSLRVV